MKRLTHLLEAFVAGVPRSICGKYVHIDSITAYPKHTSCAKCLLKRGKK